METGRPTQDAGFAAMPIVAVDASRPASGRAAWLSAVSMLPTIGLHLFVAGVLYQTQFTVDHAAPRLIVESDWTIVCPVSTETVVDFELEPPPEWPLPLPRFVAEPQWDRARDREELAGPELPLPPREERAPDTAAPLAPEPVVDLALTRTLAGASLGDDVGTETVESVASGGAGAQAARAAAGAPCVVFLLDNTVAGEDGAALRLLLSRRLESLDGKRLFYVIAYDHVTHRMFSEFSPAPAALAPTKQNLWLVAEWLEELGKRADSAAAGGQAIRPTWAAMHAMQLRPEAIVLFTGGELDEGFSGYLRSVNRSSVGAAVVPVHIVGVTRDAGGLEAIARENGGSCEYLRASRATTLAAHDE